MPGPRSSGSWSYSTKCRGTIGVRQLAARELSASVGTVRRRP
ncbi:hypothetical protein ACFPRL_15725 [Pseudoclavibacter helvolus]